MDETAFYSVALLVLMAACWLMSVIPSCGHEECNQAHQRHTGAERVESIERNHAIFHSADRPQPGCGLCQKKRDDP